MKAQLRSDFEVLALNIHSHRVTFASTPSSPQHLQPQHATTLPSADNRKYNYSFQHKSCGLHNHTQRERVRAGARLLFSFSTSFRLASARRSFVRPDVSDQILLPRAFQPLFRQRGNRACRFRSLRQLGSSALSKHRARLPSRHQLRHGATRSEEGAREEGGLDSEPTCQLR